MARERSPNRDKAFEIYKENNGDIDLVKIAEILEISAGTVRGWKNKDSWEAKLNGTFPKAKRNAPKEEKRKKGGQPRNKNAEKTGFFSKYLPPETFDLIKELEHKDPLDILWENIQIQYAAIIRAQHIMYVKDKEEMIKEIKRRKDGDTVDEVEWEFQFAWDRQATFLNAQSRALKTLEGLIKQYDVMVNSNVGLATEEQKLRIEKLKTEIGNMNKDDGVKDITIKVVKASERNGT